MSTPNFRDMEYNMPMVCGALSDDETECYIEFEMAEQLAEDFSNSLTFHDVTIESGHYYGFQFWVEEKYSKYFDLDKSSEYCIDNEDAHYYFDMFRSQALRAADAEKRKIAKWLEKLQDDGFEILVCTENFSNGEAIYSRATPRTKFNELENIKIAGKTMLKATNILWDVDYDDDGELPTEIDIPEGMTDEDEISDYLSEVTGYCHQGYVLEENK